MTRGTAATLTTLTHRAGCSSPARCIALRCLMVHPNVTGQCKEWAALVWPYACFFCFRSLHLWRKREGRGRRLRWCVRLIRVRGEHMRVSPSVRSHTHNKRHLTDSRAAHDPLLSTHTHQHACTPFHPPPHERANPRPPPDTHVMHILCGVPHRPV